MALPTTLAPKVFKELGAYTVTMGNEPNGFNINDQCGSTHMEGLQHAVLMNRQTLVLPLMAMAIGYCLVDEQGEIVDGDELIYIIAQHRNASVEGCNGVAGTQMSNLGLELALQEMNIPFTRTKVGDRYVVEALKANTGSLGGEASGHVSVQRPQ